MNKPWWVVASLLSITYATLFALVSHSLMQNNLLFGFCVWGYPSTPDQLVGCSEATLNSHSVAFFIDLAQFGLVGVLYVMDASPQHTKATAVYGLQAFFILVHGLMHCVLQQSVLPIQINCYSPDLHAHFYIFGALAFFIFSFFIAHFVLALGFGEMLELNKKRTFASLVFASLVLALTYHSDWELIFPTLFVMAHPLACATGLFSARPRFNSYVATIFAICTLFGVLELCACPSVLRPIGGHLWYDVTLHSTGIVALPYFWAPGARSHHVVPSISPSVNTSGRTSTYASAGNQMEKKKKEEEDANSLMATNHIEMAVIHEVYVD